MTTSVMQAKSRKYPGVFEVKSRVKTWQVRGILVSTIGALASPKMGTEPGVRKGKRSLLAREQRRLQRVQKRDEIETAQSLLALQSAVPDVCDSNNVCEQFLTELARGIHDNCTSSMKKTAS